MSAKPSTSVYNESSAVELAQNSTTSREPSNVPSPDSASDTSRHAPRLENPEHDKDLERHSRASNFRFWSIIASLCMTAILSALEGTIVSTALPTVVSALGGGELYLWAANGYFLASTAVLPLYAQIADIFGRRWPTITAVSLFILGSGIGGGAISMHMLIGGRVIQGIGGGGITVLVNLIVSDLVPVRQRGKYFAMIYGSTTVANGLGPFISGVIVTNASWRWIFYLNLPIGGLALCLLVTFLHVKSDKGAILEKLKQIDFLGHFIFVSSITSILISLTYAGNVHPWSSWRTILPLSLGFAGLVAYLVYEGLGTPTHPSMPLRIFANRTSGTVFGLGFLHSLLTIWTIYFLPVYFQSVKGSSPERAGIQLLPTILILLPFAVISGKVLERFGFYRLLHGIGFAAMTAGFGVFTLLTATSSTAEWVLVQFLQAAGGGLVVSTMLPAVQAPLPDADTAVVTGAFSFVRSFGITWAVTVPASLFNNRFGQLAYRISDANVRSELSGGKAYEHGTKAFVGSLQGQTKAEVIGVYSDSLKFVWQVAIGISGFAFLLVFLEKHYELRKSLDTKFGVEEKEKEKEKEDS